MSDTRTGRREQQVGSFGKTTHIVHPRQPEDGAASYPRKTLALCGSTVKAEPTTGARVSCVRCINRATTPASRAGLVTEHGTPTGHLYGRVVLVREGEEPGWIGVVSAATVIGKPTQVAVRDVFGDVEDREVAELTVLAG
jgi:hypothetical protein